MNTSSTKILILVLLFVFIRICYSSDSLIVKRQISNPATNCYLIYSAQTKEAAIIDISSTIDTLLSVIEQNKLLLKYIFFTHGHFDHVMGLPEVKEKYPRAKVCITTKDFDDMQVQLDWFLENMSSAWLKRVREDPKASKMLEFDAKTFGIPEIFIEDNQIFKLGNNRITAILTPGHSAGSVCYYVGNMLFSGDLLFYRNVGGTVVQNASKEELIKSVQKLYDLLPDNTIVYPGHGPSTDIGSEKVENTKINIKTVNM